MKKIIVFMLLLLPLIIVASVLLAVDIISVEAYIPVEKIVLNQSYVELALSEQNYDELVATVYPTSANDRKVSWKVEDVKKTVSTYDGIAAEVDTSGKVSFFTYSTFNVVASAAGKSATCTFYIKGDKVESVEILSNISSIATGESSLLSAVFHPIDAIVKNVLWQSSNNAVLSVDNNGIVTGKASGKATVTVSVVGEEISAMKEITVTTGVSMYGESFFASEGFSLAGIENPKIISGGRISDDNKLYFYTNKVILSSNGKEITITNCQSDDIIIENASFFVDYKLKVGKLPLTLSAIYREAGRTDKPSVTWISSDTTKADINNDGLVLAKETGLVTFTVKDNETPKTQIIAIKVVKPVSLIVLQNEENKLGIAQERIYGNKNLVDGKYEKSYVDIKFAIPTNANINEFIYEVMDEGKAYFEGNRLYFTENIVGIEKFTIKISAKERPYESVEVFTLYEIMVGDGVNCKDYNDLRATVDAKEIVFLQSDIHFASGMKKFVLKNHFYGNGFSFEGMEYPNKKEETNLLEIGGSNITLSNLRISFDDPEKINDTKGLNGYLLMIGQKEQEERFENIVVEYCTFENGYYAVSIHNSDATINGCIMRNASNFGIYLPSDKKENGESDYSNLVLQNNIISNIIAPAVGIVTEAPDLENQSSLKIKGFIDIYNWQDLSSSNNKMFNREIIKNNNALDGIVKGLINNMLDKELKKEEYNEIKHSKNDGNMQYQYIHLGMIKVGAFNESTVEIINDDKNLIAFDLDVLTTLKIGKKPIIPYPVILYCYKNTSEITPESTFQESFELYEKLRGER